MPQPPKTMPQLSEIMEKLIYPVTYNYMVTTCTDDALEYMWAAKTANSYRDARKAWKNLFERYKSIKDDLIALSEEFDNCKMKKLDDDPCQWYVELEYLQLWMECMGEQKKTKAEMVPIIMDQMPAKYEVVTSALRAKPVEEQTLDLVRTVYWLYWDANLKGMEQSSESDANVTLHTDSGKQGDDEQDKKRGRHILFWNVHEQRT